VGLSEQRECSLSPQNELRSPGPDRRDLFLNNAWGISDPGAGSVWIKFAGGGERPRGRSLRP
jgi:hypothetical protein